MSKDKKPGILDRLTENMDLDTAIEYRDMANKYVKKSLISCLRIGILFIGVGLLMFGCIVFVDTINPPDTARDLGLLGNDIFNIGFGLWAGISISTIVLADTVQTHFKRLVENRIHDYINDGKD